MLRAAASLIVALLACAPTARADLAFVDAPYVDRLGQGSATLHVRTDGDVPVRATFEVEGRRETRESPAGRVHALLVSGLPDGAEVQYRVEASGHRTRSGHFRTPPADAGRPVDFLVVGDCRDGDADHARVIGSMRGDHDFLLHLGDMVPTGGSDEQWSQFLRVASPVLARMAIVPVLGNHEIIAPVGATLYRQHFAMPDPRGAAYYAFSFGGARVLVLDSNADLTVGSPQHDFAVRELERASADATLTGLFVAVHQGPYSSGRHGGMQEMHTSGLVDAMRRARVDLVFSGHDHTYERGEAEGLKYVVSGGCGSPLYHSNAHEPYQLAFVPTYHHVAVRIADGRIAIDVVESNGHHLERCSFARGEHFQCGVRHLHAPRAGVTPTEDGARRFGPAIAAALALGFAAAAYQRFRRRPPTEATR